MPSKRSSLQITTKAFSSYKKFKRIQISFLLLLVIFLIAIFLGLSGHGIFSKREMISETGQFKIQYDKFIRQNSVTEVSIFAFAKNRQFSLSVSRNYLQNQFIKEINPQPAFAENRENKITYYFINYNNSPIKIRFLFEPIKFGLLTGKFEINNQELLIKQFIFP